jgi:hypothetical protein
MADVFVSFASADLEIASVVVGALEREGWSVFWDRKLLPGSLIHEVIEQELSTASVVVVLWSRASLASHWVVDEAGAARHKLVPCRIEDVLPPLSFRSLNHIDLLGWAGDQGASAFQMLITAIRLRMAPGRDVSQPQNVVVDDRSRRSYLSRSKVVWGLAMLVPAMAVGVLRYRGVADGTGEEMEERTASGQNVELEDRAYRLGLAVGSLQLEEFEFDTVPPPSADQLWAKALGDAGVLEDVVRLGCLDSSRRLWDEGDARGAGVGSCAESIERTLASVHDGLYAWFAAGRRVALLRGVAHVAVYAPDSLGYGPLVFRAIPEQLLGIGYVELGTAVARHVEPSIVLYLEELLREIDGADSDSELQWSVRRRRVLDWTTKEFERGWSGQGD